MDSQTIFAELRNVLAELYPEEQDARVAVSDAGLDPRQITFSPRAQTNWHNILAEAIKQNRLDILLQVVRSTYGDNLAFQAAYDQYRQWVEQGGHIEPLPSLTADSNSFPTITTGGGTLIAGNVTADAGDVIGRDQHIGSDKVGRDKIEGDQINAHGAKVVITRPTTPFTLNIGTLKIPFYLLATIIFCLIGIFSAAAYPLVKTWLPAPRMFNVQADGETLIVIATFHNTAATNSEAHIKIRRAIVSEAEKNNEQHLRVEVEPTELTADQRTEAEALGNRYNASMVIWGEDTGVEVIVNFLNLKEPDFDAASTIIIERERTQLANPGAYDSFITSDLPQTMNFFVFFTVGQFYYLNKQYALATEQIEAAIALLSPDVKPEGLADAYFRLGWLYQQAPEMLDEAIADYDRAIDLNSRLFKAYNNRGTAYTAQNKLTEAIADYTQAIQLKPDFAEAYYNRGTTYAIQYKPTKAVADLTKAIQIKPDYPDAKYNLGIAHTAQDTPPKVANDNDRPIYPDPNLAKANNNQITTNITQSRPSGSHVDYKAVRPVGAAITGSIAPQNKLTEAITDYRHYLELRPTAKNRVQVEQWIAQAEAESAKSK